MAGKAQSRTDLWVGFMAAANVAQMAEIGVFKGQFAATMLKECPSISRYYMIDPWQHLQDWNKPANKDNEVFEAYLAETKARTDFAAAKRVILRGRTLDVIDEIPDGSLDFAYVDGDHTLRGIVIDLMRVYPKVRIGGWIGGDDFGANIWQHGRKFEPSLVFPFALYFAEAVGARIYALPNSQFLFQKPSRQNPAFIDLTGRYSDTSLRSQFLPEKAPR